MREGGATMAPQRRWRSRGRSWARHTRCSAVEDALKQPRARALLATLRARPLWALKRDPAGHLGVLAALCGLGVAPLLPPPRAGSKEQNAGRWLLGVGAARAALTRPRARREPPFLTPHQANAELSASLREETSRLAESRAAAAAAAADAARLRGEAEERGAHVAELQAEVDAARAAAAAAAVELESRREAAEAAEARCLRLSQEMDDLLQRWMAEKTAAADKLNAANEIYQDVVRNAQSLELQAAAARRGGSSSAGMGLLEQAAAQAPGGAQAVGAPRVVARRVATAHEGGAHALAYAPSGERLYTGGADRAVRVWEAGSGAAAGVLAGCMGTVLGLAVSGDGSSVLAASADKSLRLWDTGSGRLRHSLTGHMDRVVGCALHPGDAMAAASGGQDRCVKVWDLTKGLCKKSVLVASNVTCVAYSPDGAMVLSGHLDGALRLWDPRTGNSAGEMAGLHGAAVAGVVVEPTTGEAFTLGRDGCVKRVDIRVTGGGGGSETLATYSAPGFRVGLNACRPAAAPGGGMVAAGGADGTVCTWDVRSGRVAHRTAKGHAGAVAAVEWSPAGGPFASVDKTGSLILWGD